MLTNLKLEGFRAFARPTEIDCDADAIVLVGPNGTGKTTFFDAIEWALFGKVSRLPSTRDAVGGSYLANRFTPRRTEVNLRLTSGDMGYCVRRTRDWATTSDAFAVIDDTGHETRGTSAAHLVANLTGSPRGSAAETAFLRSQCLIQDRIGRFVRDATPRERFDSLSELLGVDTVRHFYRWIDESGGRATDRANALGLSIRTLNGKIGDAEARVAALAQQARAESEITIERLGSELADLEATARALGLKWPHGMTSSDPSRILAIANDVLAQIEMRAETCAAAIREAHTLQTDQGSIEAARAVLPELAARSSSIGGQRQTLELQRGELSKELEAHSSELAELEGRLKARKTEREEFARFLVSAKAFIQTDRCPVCEQEIRRQDVLASLMERSKSLSEEERSILESRDGVVRRLSAAKATRDGIDLRLADVRRTEAEANQRSLVSRRAVDAWKKRELQLLAAFPASVDVAGVVSVAGSTEQSLNNLKSKLIGIQSQAKALVDRRELVSARAVDLGLRNERAPMLEEDQRLKVAASTFAKLTRDAKAAEIEIVQGLITAQMPVLRALYQRLNPHPLFDGLDVTYDDFGGKGEVYYRARRGDTTGNVSMMFSSAQLNAVGVCIFLSLSLMRPAGDVSWILLDDPIQNMDDYNILGLVDLLRSFRGQRQVIVSTHDDQIGELLRRKLRPQRPDERTAVHRFLSIDEEGPKIVSTVDRFVREPFVLEAAAAS